MLGRAVPIVATLVLVAALVAVVLAVLAGPGLRFGLYDDFLLALIGFLRFAAYTAFAALGLAVLWLILAAISGDWSAWMRVAAAVVVAAIVAYFPLAMMQKGGTVPPIHDITTDTADPPKFVAVLPLRSKAKNPPEYLGGKVTEQQKAAYPDIQPIVSQKPPAELFASALNAADALGWEIVDKNPIEGRIEATATSLWFGFKDDVVIRIRPEGTGSRLDIRSKSRVGVGDVGANADRIRAFRDKLGA